MTPAADKALTQAGVCDRIAAAADRLANQAPEDRDIYQRHAHEARERADMWRAIAKKDGR